MGKFDGILLASDWDGTICDGINICRENIEAINYFKSEGGLFTICTGRHYSYLDRFREQVKPDTYLITLNGALIVNPTTKDVLYEGFLSNEYIEIIKDLYAKKGLFERLDLWEYGATHSSELGKDEFLAISESLKERKIHKALLVSNLEENAINCSKYVNEMGYKTLSASRSWKYSMELINPNSNKGNAIKRLAKSLGARLTVAVGDYENDISMLDEADISFAPSNAPDHVKAHASIICSSVSEGSIASVIQTLEKRINTNSASK